MEAAKFAQAKYIADAKGAKGIIRKFFRLTGDHSSTITSWVGLLPSDQYFSIMCGGLKLILGVHMPLILCENYKTLVLIIPR
jgi:hypothetical protein